MILELNLTLNGVKTCFSVEVSPETYGLLSGSGLDQSLMNNTDDDLLEGVILPSLMEATQRLVEVNHIFSGNLAKLALGSLQIPNV